MTEEIDLDEMDVDEDSTATPNPGDWFWRDDGDPAVSPGADDEPAETDHAQPGQASDADTAGENAGQSGTGGPESAATGEASDAASDPIPHVPREKKDKPVGIPVEGGGAGGASARARSEPDAASADESDGEPETADDRGAGEPTTRASGPHGGGVDDMTMALTYRAMQRLDDPRRVVGDARAWADWVGIVGDVEAFVIKKFQRDNQIDVDFFNGSSQGPAERLADVDEHSMFFAERMVVVGLDDEEWIATRADWEFVPLSEAAGKAEWELTE